MSAKECMDPYTQSPSTQEIHAYSYEPMLTFTCLQAAVCNVLRRKKLWGSSFADCNPDCFPLNSLVSLGRKVCLVPQSEAKEQKYLLRMYYIPLSTSFQNIQTSVLECCMQQTGVKNHQYPKLLIHTNNISGQEPLFCSLSALCLLQ